MNSNSILLILGGVAIIAFIVVLIIQSSKKKLISTVSKLQDNPSLFSDSDIGRNLSTLIIALSNDSKNSSVILDKLKSNPQECAEELTHAFTKLREIEYNARWLIVYCASQFELPEFIKLLSQIAKSEIPNEKSENIHLFSTVAEETAIRLTAIEGIKNIGQKSYKEAETELLDLLRVKYLTLNIASCQSLMEINNENKKNILDTLPKEKQFITDIKRKDVREIPFIKNTVQKIALSKTYLPKPQRGKSNITEPSRRISNSKRPKIN